MAPLAKSLWPNTAHGVPLRPQLKGEQANWVSQLDGILAQGHKSASLRPPLRKEEQGRDNSTVLTLMTQGTGGLTSSAPSSARHHTWVMAFCGPGMAAATLMSK